MNDVESVRALLQQGADLEQENSKGWTALMVASETDYTELVELLLSAGADVHHTSDEYGRTALLLATWTGITRNVELLVSAGANIRDIHYNGRTPLLLAVYSDSS